MKAPIVIAMLAVLSLAAPALAFNCPVVIKQAEDLVRKAENRLHAQKAVILDLLGGSADDV
jgi:hypothetical protein